MNISQQLSSQIRVENIEILENPRYHSFFETTWLRDAGEFGGVQTCYRYLLRELRPFLGSIRRGNRETRHRIAREGAFDSRFGSSGDAHHANI